MDNTTIQLINELASDIIKCFDVNIPITNISKLVTDLGGVIYEDEGLPLFHNGKIDRTQNDVPFQINIPCQMSLERKNLHIALQLGYLFLYMGYLIDDDVWESTKNKTDYCNANLELHLKVREFAMALLMPKNIYHTIIQQVLVNNIVDMSKVAVHFHVPIDTAIYRGETLGLIGTIRRR